MRAARLISTLLPLLPLLFSVVIAAGYREEVVTFTRPPIAIPSTNLTILQLDYSEQSFTTTKALEEVITKTLAIDDPLPTVVYYCQQMEEICKNTRDSFNRIGITVDRAELTYEGSE